MALVASGSGGGHGHGGGGAALGGGGGSIPGAGLASCAICSAQCKLKPGEFCAEFSKA
jgi:hypothetical protein